MFVWQRSPSIPETGGELWPWPIQHPMKRPKGRTHGAIQTFKSLCTLFISKTLHIFMIHKIKSEENKASSRTTVWYIKKYPDHKTRVFYLLSFCIPESLTASSSSSMWKIIECVSNKTPWLGNCLGIRSSRSKSPLLWRTYTFFFLAKCPGALPYEGQVSHYVFG